jgi:hypothetical protein
MISVDRYDRYKDLEVTKPETGLRDRWKYAVLVVIPKCFRTLVSAVVLADQLTRE